ncbi:chemotaxis protein CheW [Sphingomonas flavalba]|uniref:chemotaxis protein CheW n=1 Tax=Sphingomonas flavalba TaxID=2559804 RepID=UPI0039DF9303
MDKLFLLCTIAGQPAAIRAVQVDSVVDIGPIAPVPLAPPHVIGLAALRSRLLTIICCNRALGLPPPAKPTSRAVVVTVDGHPYGLLVGSIDDARVIEQEPVPVRARLEPGWARVVTGMVDFEGEALLIVDPERLIGGPEEDALAQAS